MLRFRWIASAVVVALVGAAVACSGTSSSQSAVPPVTGVTVRAETITSGRGCGPGATQVFKYAVILFGYSGAGAVDDPAAYTVPVAGGVFDCFADGTFVNLTAQNRSTRFRIEVYAYNQAAYIAASAQIESGAAARDPNVLRATNPSWTTACEAIQQTDVQTLAACSALGVGLSGLGGEAGRAQIIIQTGSFQRADGSVIRCSRGEGDAGATDASPDAPEATDAGDAGDAADGGVIDAGDAGPDAANLPSTATFSTVRATFSTQGATEPPVSIGCPDQIVKNDALPLATYTIDVALLGDDGEVIGTTSCTAVTQAGQTGQAGQASYASCEPVH